MTRRLRTSPAELRGQLVALALALWTVAIVNSATSTPFLRSGQLRGTDFVQFYTLGRLAASGNIRQFDNFDAIRRTQLEAVPVATGVWFPPVYGPQIPLLMAPLGRLSYGIALLVWVLTSAVAYLLLCRVVIARTLAVRSYPATALLGAVAFPAYWQLLQHGQLTVIALALIVGAWLRMRARADWQAGLLLGLLVYKPPLLAPMLFVLVLARSWRMVAGAVLSALLEVGLTSFWVGLDGLRRYVLLTIRLPAMATLLFTKPEQSHGLKAFWTILIPAPRLDLALYVWSSTFVVLLAARLWRHRADASWRMTVLLLGVSLATPYLFVYDLTILAPAWIWLVDWFLTHDVPARVGRALYAGYLAPLAAPLVPFLRVQPSTVCFGFLLVALWKFRDASGIPQSIPLSAAQGLGSLSSMTAQSSAGTDPR